MLAMAAVELGNPLALRVELKPTILRSTRPA
jgi:hypothetical protein